MSESMSDLSSRAMAAPAGVLGTITGTVCSLPNLLVGDVVAAYKVAAAALADFAASGVCERIPGMAVLVLFPALMWPSVPSSVCTEAPEAG
jgi:hypothetical protein